MKCTCSVCIFKKEVLMVEGSGTTSTQPRRKEGRQS